MCSDNVVKFEQYHVVSGIHEQTDKQTDMLTAMLYSPIGGGVTVHHIAYELSDGCSIVRRFDSSKVRVRGLGLGLSFGWLGLG